MERYFTVKNNCFGESTDRVLLRWIGHGRQVNDYYTAEAVIYDDLNRRFEITAPNMKKLKERIKKHFDLKQFKRVKLGKGFVKSGEFKFKDWYFKGEFKPLPKHGRFTLDKRPLRNEPVFIYDVADNASCRFKNWTEAKKALKKDYAKGFKYEVYQYDKEDNARTLLVIDEL